MLGKEKDLNIQLKPQQILETKSPNKKKPTPIHVAEQILNLHQSEARKYNIFQTMHIIFEIYREAFKLKGFFPTSDFSLLLGEALRRAGYYKY